jgi:hypothetical protein
MKLVRATTNKDDPKVPKYGIKPWNDHQWIYMADRLREYADLEDSYYVDVFALQWGFSPYRMKRKWIDDNQYFAAAMEYAVGVINARRNDMLTFSQKIVDRRDWLDKRPLYDKEYLEWLRERALMNKPDTAALSEKEIHVHVNAIPDSPVVKPLPEDKEK